ncbi:MAG: hypothetical protein Q9210_003444 [Variospora velana]
MKSILLRLPKDKNGHGNHVEDMEDKDLEEGDQSLEDEDIDSHDSDQDGESLPFNHAATDIIQRKCKGKAHRYQPTEKKVTSISSLVPPVDVARRAPSSPPFTTISDDLIGEIVSSSPVAQNTSSPLLPIDAATNPDSPIPFIPDVDGAIEAGLPTAQSEGELHPSGTRGSIAASDGVQPQAGHRCTKRQIYVR